MQDIGAVSSRKRLELLDMVAQRKWQVLARAVLFAGVSFYGARTYGDNALYIFAFIPALCAVIHFMLSRNYSSARVRLISSGSINIWENFYHICLGIWCVNISVLSCYASIYYFKSVLFDLAAFLSVLVLMTLATKSYGRIAHVNVLAGIVCFPPAITIALSGYLARSWEDVVLSGFIILTFTAVREVAVSLHNVDSQKEEVVTELEANEHKFDVVMATIAHGLIVVDETGVIYDINSIASNIFQTQLKRGDKICNLAMGLLTAEDCAKLKDKLNEVLSGAHSSIVLKVEDEKWLQFRLKNFDALEYGFVDTPMTTGRQYVVVSVEDISEQFTNTNTIDNLLRKDHLTQILNRNYWKANFQSLISKADHRDYAGVCIIGLRKFRNINEKYGHKVGDLVLSHFSARLADMSSESIIVGRVGGNLFAVGVLDIAQEAISERVDRIFEEISRPYIIDGEAIDVDIRGGLISSLASEMVVEECVNKANAAMKKVSGTRNKAWLLFDAAMEEDYKIDLRVKADLKRAIAQDELELVFQPIFAVETGEIAFAEALCRWRHADLGNIAPLRFVTVAEENGMIGDLTRHVIRKACVECLTWPENIGVAVNLSVTDLMDVDVYAMVNSVLMETGLAPDRLCVEMTETVFLADYKRMAAVLQSLRYIGVKTSLDDFGTGFSSLSHLNNLPFTKVKVDREFVNSLFVTDKSCALLSAVVAMAKELEMEVVVEGVETIEQYDFVSNVGADYVQGFLFSQPVSSDAVCKAQAPKTVFEHIKDRKAPVFVAEWRRILKTKEDIGELSAKS